MTAQTNPTTGVTDKFHVIRLLEGQSNEDITSKLGKIINASWNIQEDSEREADVNSGAEYRDQTDQMVLVNGSVTIRAPDFKIFRLQGDYNEPDANTWEVELTDALPEFQLRLQVKDGVVLDIYCVKFGRAEISVTKNGYVEVTFDYQARVNEDGDFYQFDDGITLDDPVPEGYSKQGLDLEFQLDGTPTGSGESFTFTYNRDLDPDKGIEPNSQSPRRAPTQLIEQMKDFSMDGEVAITELDVLKAALDDDTFPLQLQNRRTDVSMGLGLDPATAGTVTVTGGRINDPSGEISNDAEKRTMDISSVATGATITGDL